MCLRTELCSFIKFLPFSVGKKNAGNRAHDSDSLFFHRQKSVLPNNSQSKSKSHFRVPSHAAPLNNSPQTFLQQHKLRERRSETWGAELRQTDIRDADEPVAVTGVEV